jgi:acyl-CoA synthetase (AMP-forming)/AMP-acid ligase II
VPSFVNALDLRRTLLLLGSRLRRSDTVERDWESCWGPLLNSVNLADVFVAMASRWPDRTAIISPNLILSFGHLVARAARSARELRLRGIVAEANVGIGLRDNAESVVFMIALWMLRATAVPIDFRTNAAERSLLAREFDLIAIIEDRQVATSGYNSIFIDHSWPEIIAKHDGSPIWTSEAQVTATAFISLTSGTTGRPIGIVIDHERMLLRSIVDLWQRLEASLLNPLPLSFSASRTHVFSALLQGSAVNFHPVLFSAQQLAEAILASGATSVCAVPTIIRNFLEIFGDPSTPVFSKLEALYCFGAPMSPAENVKAKTFLCDKFVQVYGSSICGRISTLSGADLEAQSDTQGRILPHVALQVVDADDQVLPLGEAGVLRLRSPGMARSIYGTNTRASGDKLKEGWAYPGDIGSLDQGGFLRLLGRSSDLIIRGGVNVYPSEVEAAIAEQEGVREVAVVGFSKLPEGEEIAAIIVPSSNLTEAALVAHCRARLSPDKRPRKFVFVTELPRNANGKISRATLRQQLESASEA